MSRYKRTFTKYRREIIFSSLLSLLFSIVLLFWHFALGKSFVWKDIEPISAPDLFERYFYSAFTFVTFGAFLYWIKFYKLLHTIIVGLFNDWKLYKDIKSFIWGGLILLSFFWAVPRIVDFLNSVISFLYNIFGLVLYLLPSLGIALILSFPTFVYVKKYLK